MLKVGQQDCDNISLNITLFLAWLHNRFPVFLPVVMPVRGGIHVLGKKLFSLVKLLNAGICISGIRPASDGVNLPKWTSSRCWSISAVYTVYTVHPTIHRGLGVQYSTVINSLHYTPLRPITHELRRARDTPTFSGFFWKFDPFFLQWNIFLRTR